MRGMNTLDLCIDELRSAAQSLNALTDSLMALFIRGDDAQAPAPKTKPMTLEQVRAALAEKSRDGHTAEVRALLEKHGAAKLSEIDPKEYAALLAEAEVLGNR